MMPTFSKVAEAEVPIALEKLASRDWADRYQFEISGDRGQTDVKVGKMISGIVKDLSKGVDRSIVSGKFHNTVAEIVAAVCVKIGKRSRLSKVLLSGGVFQNRLLSDRASYLLGQRGFDVYRHLRVDTNDNGIPVGQIAIANSRVLCA